MNAGQSLSLNACADAGESLSTNAGVRAGIHAVLAALDAADAPVNFFIRDDDAGWDDARLFALLDCTQAAGVPIDLAVIPQATSAPLARALCERVDASGGAIGGTIGLHQHGHAHQNFESIARKCEFGPARSLRAQRADLLAGRQHLLGCFGDRLEATFTPPWNRCSGATPGLLAELGYTALSRDRTAPPQFALPELPVDADWCREQRLAAERGESGCARVGAALAQRVRGGATVGLMLHHAAMSDAEFDALRTSLRAWSAHPRARWQRMHRCLPAAPGADATRTHEELP